MRFVAAIALLYLTGIGNAAVTNTKTEDLDCMFLGYPELEYDGFDRTEVKNFQNFALMPNNSQNCVCIVRRKLIDMVAIERS